MTVGLFAWLLSSMHDEDFMEVNDLLPVPAYA